MTDIESSGNLSNIKNQLYATIIANAIILVHGLNVGWLSPSLPILMSKDTPLSTGPITNEDLSWLGSISSIGSIIATIVCGLLSATVGCKRAMIFLAFPAIVFWLLVHFCSTYQGLLIGRLTVGMTGGGIQAGVTLYISEIVNDNIRGRIGSITPLARNVGLLIAFFIGAIVKYEYIPYICIFPPIIYLILLLFLPNTPQFYLNKGDFQSAEKALMFYKGCKGENDRKKNILNAEFNRLKSIIEERKNRPKMQISDFYSSMAVKGIVISISVSWFLQTTGCFIITNFASFIFEKSGTSLGIHTSSIILAIVQIVGGLVSTQIADTFGRKTTLFISLSGSAVGLFIFSAYMYVRHYGYDVTGYLWIPVASLSLIIFISAAGVMALSNICTIENFPSELRTAGMVFYSLCNNAVAFIGDKYFPILTETIFLHGFLLFLAINCCIGSVLIMFMDETKGSSLDTLNSTKGKFTSNTDSNNQNRF